MKSTHYSDLIPCLGCQNRPFLYQGPDGHRAYCGVAVCSKFGTQTKLYRTRNRTIRAWNKLQSNSQELEFAAQGIWSKIAAFIQTDVF